MQSASAPATVDFRPRSARWTAGVIIVLALAAALAQTLAEGPYPAVPTIGLAALACVVAIGAYWRPQVRVSETTVEVVNVLSTVTVPLARVVHVDTRWALELHLDDGRKVSAFAAPAPGTSKARGFRLEDVRGLPEDTYSGGAIRIGDSPGTPSGDAAILVRAALAAWRADGVPDDRAVSRSINVLAVVAFAAGVSAAILGFIV